MRLVEGDEFGAKAEADDGDVDLLFLRHGERGWMKGKRLPALGEARDIAAARRKCVNAEFGEIARGGRSFLALRIIS
jgi:hypothetical protein